jgi:hypothetical protein
MDISSIFVLVQSENMWFSTPLKTVQTFIANWLHSTLFIFNPHTTPVRLINKTLLQNGITQLRNAQFTNVLTYISRLLEALQGWTGNSYNCTHQLRPSEILRGTWDRGEKNAPKFDTILTTTEVVIRPRRIV